MTFTHTERMVPGTSKWLESYAEHIVRYRRAVDSQSVISKALDIGCGVGYGSYFLAQNGAEVTAVDYSEEAISLAGKHFPHERVKYLQDDAQTLLRVNDTYDIITAFEVYEHIHNPEGMLERVAQMLNRTNGYFYCSTPNTLFAPKLEDGVTPRNKYHVREYSEAEFLNSLKQHFAKVEILGQHHSDRYLQISRAIREVAVQSMTRDLTLKSNPFIRVGCWLQKMRGANLSFPEPKPGQFPPPSTFILPPIEEDFVFKSEGVENCKYFYAICSH